MSRPSLAGVGQVIPIVAGLAERFDAAGHRLYLVGGVVRDLALGVASAADDIDLTTDATPDVIKQLVSPIATALWSQGERFGTIGATVNGRDLEITTHRAEAYDPASRKPTVVFGRSVEDDLARRDFTINAMAVSLPDGALIDPFGGMTHLDQRVLATPLSPGESFSEDPLRMMRAARFLPRFALTADPGVEASARELAPRLAIVSVERISAELERLLALPQVEQGVRFLHDCGLLVEVIPAYRPDPAAATRAATLAAGDGSADVRRAGLFAPVGVDGVRAALTRLRYPRAVVATTVGLVEALPVALGRDVTPADVRRTVDRVGLDAIADLRQLAANHRRTDPAGDPAGAEPDAVPGGVPGTEPTFDAVYEALAAEEDLTDLSIPLSGRDIMRHLDLAPGPEVGEAARHLRAARIEHGPLTVEAALGRPRRLGRRPRTVVIGPEPPSSAPDPAP